MRSAKYKSGGKEFKWKHYEGEIILWAVRWYSSYPISYRNLQEMALERGLAIYHTTPYRWVQEYAPKRYWAIAIARHQSRLRPIKMPLTL